MSAELSGSERVIGRPFARGVSGNPGGMSKKLRKVRKALEQLDDAAVKRMAELIGSDDEKVAVAAVGLWAKYRLPVPKEATAGTLTITQAPTLPVDIARALATMAPEGEG